MITINTAESALKNIYLETVVNDINTKTNPFLTMIAGNTKTVAEKDARASIRFNNDGAVAAGEEAAELPTSCDARQADIVVPLKNIYGTFQVTDKAIKAAQNNPGAFASLIGGEMQNLVAAAQRNLNRMIFGSGEKDVLAVAATMNSTSNLATFADASRLRAGMYINAFCNQGNQVNPSPMRITEVMGNNATFTTTGMSVNPTMAPFTWILAGGAQTSEKELSSIETIFDTDTLYNLKREKYEDILPFDRSNLGTAPISEDDVMDFLDLMEEHAGIQSTNLIMTHPNMRKALFDSLSGSRLNADATELAGGFRALTFNGIPVYSDVKCRRDALYALNTDGWAMHQLCDWTWLEGDDGAILRQIPGKSVFSATLVKYADLICEKPFLQGRLTGKGAR